MARYKVEIPFLVWYEITVEAGSKEEAFKKAFRRISDKGLVTAGYDEEQLEPEKVGWCVYEEGDKDFGYSLNAQWFCRTPKEED